MKEIKLKVDMHCASCAISIEKALKKKGCEVKSNPALKLVKVTFDENKMSTQDIKEEIKKVGYDAQES